MHTDAITDAVSDLTEQLTHADNLIEALVSESEEKSRVIQALEMEIQFLCSGLRKVDLAV